MLEIRELNLKRKCKQQRARKHNRDVSVSTIVVSISMIVSMRVSFGVSSILRHSIVRKSKSGTILCGRILLLKIYEYMPINGKIHWYYKKLLLIFNEKVASGRNPKLHMLSNKFLTRSYSFYNWMCCAKMSCDILSQLIFFKECSSAKLWVLKRYILSFCKTLPI